MTDIEKLIIEKEGFDINNQFIYNKVSEVMFNIVNKHQFYHFMWNPGKEYISPTLEVLIEFYKNNLFN